MCCYYGSAILELSCIINLNLRVTQGVGKAYNELKQGEPAIERLFELTRFKSQVKSVFDRSDHSIKILIYHLVKYVVFKN